MSCPRSTINITTPDKFPPPVPAYAMPCAYKLKELLVNPLDNPSDDDVYPSQNPNDLPESKFSSDDDTESHKMNVMIGEVRTFARFLHTNYLTESREHSPSSLANFTQTPPCPAHSSDLAHPRHAVHGAQRSKAMNDRTRNTIASPGIIRAYVQTPSPLHHFIHSITTTRSRAFRRFPTTDRSHLDTTNEADRSQPNAADEHRTRPLLTNLLHAPIPNIGPYTYHIERDTSSSHMH